MKPFDLEAALAGAKVVTRDGKQVKIAGYNKEIYPANIALLGWVHSDIGWCEIAWFENGSYLKDEFDGFDLFMAPTERKEWIVRCETGCLIGPFDTLIEAEFYLTVANNSTIHEITIHE